MFAASRSVIAFAEHRIAGGVLEAGTLLAHAGACAALSAEGQGEHAEAREIAGVVLRYFKSMEYHTSYHHGVIGHLEHLRARCGMALGDPARAAEAACDSLDHLRQRALSGEEDVEPQIARVEALLTEAQSRTS